MFLNANGVESPWEIHNEISDLIKDIQSIAGSMLGYPTTVGSLGGLKRRGYNPTGVGGKFSTASVPSIHSTLQKTNRSCSCTRHLT